MEILSQRFDENAERIYKGRRVAKHEPDGRCENDHPAIKDPRSLTAHSGISNPADTQITTPIPMIASFFFTSGTSDRLLGARH
jgi:hypothetical protein